MKIVIAKTACVQNEKGEVQHINMELSEKIRLDPFLKHILGIMRVTLSDENKRDDLEVIQKINNLLEAFKTRLERLKLDDDKT